MLTPRLLLSAIVLASSLATPALACTTADVRSKAAAVLTKMQELATKDPQKAAEIERKLSGIQTKSITDPDRDCKLFDDILAEFE